MVKVLYEERNSRLYGESSDPPKANLEKPPKGNGGNCYKKPLPPPFSWISSSPSSSSTSTSSQTPPHYPKGHGKTPFLKLDINFELPMYNGEVNAEKLDNWVCQLEVYCRIQNIKDDETKIYLASLRLESDTLIWWEAKT